MEESEDDKNNNDGIQKLTLELGAPKGLKSQGSPLLVALKVANFHEDAPVHEYSTCSTVKEGRKNVQICRKVGKGKWLSMEEKEFEED